jgi:hypothetical protein
MVYVLCIEILDLVHALTLRELTLYEKNNGMDTMEKRAMNSPIARNEKLQSLRLRPLGSVFVLGRNVAIGLNKLVMKPSEGLLSSSRVVVSTDLFELRDSGYMNKRIMLMEDKKTATSNTGVIEGRTCELGGERIG